MNDQEKHRANGRDTLPPIKHIRFNEGELIFKEGDYGIAVYKITKGRVRIFTESGRTWFREEVFSALATIRGVHCQSDYAEAFVAEKIVIGMGR